MKCYSLAWKEFNIYLPNFHEYMRLNSNFDGFACSPEELVVEFVDDYTDSDTDYVHAYYDAVTEEYEEYKYLYDSRLVAGINITKEGMLSKTMAEMTTLEKKLLLMIDLTQEDKDDLVVVAMEAEL